MSHWSGCSNDNGGMLATFLIMGNIFLHSSKPIENTRNNCFSGVIKMLERVAYSVFGTVVHGERPLA